MLEDHSGLSQTMQGPEMAINGPKIGKMAENAGKWPEIAQNVRRSSANMFDN